MKLWEILRYDALSQLRRFSTAIYAAAMVAASILAASTFFDDVRRDGVLLNAPMVTAACVIVASMLGLLVTAALAAEAGTRDMRARMEPLLFTTPLSKRSYLGGRFLSAFGIGALLMGIVPVTLAAWTVVPFGEAAVFGPFRVAPYLRAFALLALPNTFITTALLFSLVILTRRAMSAYLGATVLFFNTMIQDGVVASALGKWGHAKHLDPFAFIIAAAHWRSHTPRQRNALTLELEPALLTNRLLWLAVSLAVLSFAYTRFRMMHAAAPAGWRRRKTGMLPDAGGKPWTQVVAPSRVRRTFTRGTWLRQAAEIALDSWRGLITSRAALLIPLLAWLAWSLGFELLEFGLGTPTRLNTGRLAFLYGKFNVSGLAVGVLVASFAGHLVWRERDARLNDIADVTPVSGIVTFLGKFAGLALMVATIQSVLIAAGILSQVHDGYRDFQSGLWVRVLLGVKMADYLIFAALAMAIHVVVNHRYLGMALAIASWVLPQYAEQFGISHGLLIYGADPGLTYSEFSGFGASVVPWLWFKLYWAGWALLFALLGALCWVRGRDSRRFAVARRRLTPVTSVIACAGIAIIGGAGGWIFYNTNVLNEYVVPDAADRRSAEYEQRYGRYAAIAQPVVSATTLHVELDNAKRRAVIRGACTLQNRSGRTIHAIHLVTRTTGPTEEVTFDGGAKATLVDERLGYRIYTLNRPLSAGESLRMQFTVRLGARGFTSAGVSPSLASNGAFLEHRADGGGRSWMPLVGYRSGVELDHPYDRNRYGLPARPAMPALTDPVARNEERGIESIHLETIVGTDADQLAVAPGSLKRSWTERGRRYYHYATDAPIRNGFPILSARYAVHRTRWNHVDIEVLHHPKHGWNADRIARSARASLEYFSREFGPYPYRQLRLVEFPITGGGRLTGYPGTVIWPEALAFAKPESDGRQIDFPFAVISHEVAHQWWGNVVRPARVEGAPLLSESLAWYSAMSVVEENFGRGHLDRLMDVMRESYLSPHETPEMPLLRANDWLAVYRTGALAMHALRKEIGAQRVNTALRRFADAHRSARPPFATSLDLHRELRAVTPPESRTLLKDLFEEVTFWDLRMKSVDVEPAGPAFRVALGLEAYRIKVASPGREARAPLDQAIEIGVFDERDVPLYRQKHRIRSGVQVITITVPRRPARAAIDPDDNLLDRNREDNSRGVARP